MLWQSSRSTPRGGWRALVLAKYRIDLVLCDFSEGLVNYFRLSGLLLIWAGT